MSPIVSRLSGQPAPTKPVLSGDLFEEQARRPERWLRLDYKFGRRKPRRAADSPSWSNLLPDQHGHDAVSRVRRAFLRKPALGDFSAPASPTRSTRKLNAAHTPTPNGTFALTAPTPAQNVGVGDIVFIEDASTPSSGDAARRTRAERIDPST